MALMYSTQPPLGRQVDEDDLMIDIDVDMDDVPAEAMADVEEDDLEEGEEPQNGQVSDPPVIAAIYTEDPAQEPQFEKVHIRGVDEMHTSDIRAFANDHFPSAEPSHIQWIDDTSVNILYPSRDIALQAMLAFVANPTTAEDIHNAPLELRQAKTLASRPISVLQIRVAMVGDRKQKGARDASRYYLFHPEHDPTERRRGGDGDYQRNKFDHRELRRRRDQDHNADSGTDFAASMYDDAPAADTQKSARGRDLFSRVSGRRGRGRSASPGRSSIANSDEIGIDDSEDDGRLKQRRSTRNGYRDRNTTPPPAYARRDPNPVPKDNVGKELFANSSTRSSRSGNRREGTLHSDKLDMFPSKATNGAGEPSNRNAAAAARLKADLLAPSSSAQTSPGRSGSNTHKRSKAMDAKNAEDLSERFARKSLSIDSTKNANLGKELFSSDELDGGETGLNIRGTAVMDQGISIKGSGGISIKGRANTRELFPEQYRTNQGKELFNDPVRRQPMRVKAHDFD